MDFLLRQSFALPTKKYRLIGKKLKCGRKRDGRKIIKYSRTTLVVTLIDFFSKTGFIMRPHRGCMGDDLAENLFDCKENLNFLWKS